MSRSTFLRIRHLSTAVFELVFTIIIGAIGGAIFSAVCWFRNLRTALKDPIGYEEATRKANEEMQDIVGTHDTHP